MARAPLSQQSEYELVNREQDIRGWQVLDTQGAALGVVSELIIDTDAERVELLVLDTGREIAVRDVTLGDHLVLVGAPAAAATQVQAAGTAVGLGSAAQAVEGLREELRLPVMEQVLRVGKREVVRGGVRVSTRVEERPVQEEITLREESVVVERRPMDLQVSDAFIDQLPTESVEVVAQAEEAVVAKQARVVQEVVVRKDVEERIETIRDSVRRTDVEVERMDSAQVPTRPRD